MGVFLKSPLSISFYVACFSFIEKRSSGKYVETSSKYYGVSWVKERKKWLARVQHNGETHSIGYFEIEEDTAKAVNLKCQELNIPLKNPSIGVLDNETLNKLTKVEKKVNNFYFNFCNYFLFWKRAMRKQCVFE